MPTDMPGARPPFIVERIDSGGPEREHCERELDARGLHVPLTHRAAWTRADAGELWYIGVRDASGRIEGGLPVVVLPSLVMPGHVALSVDRVGATLSAEARPAALRGLADIARRHPRALCVRLSTFSPDPEVRADLARHLVAAGFRRSSRVGSYLRTLSLDLAPPEEHLFAALSANTRRNIRLPAKRGFALGPIQDDSWIPRMGEVFRETLERTGGGFLPPDWSRLIRSSVDRPDLVRLTGLFAPGDGGVERLVAFACAYWHGDHASYETSASVRSSDLKAPLMYPLLWDLIVWARQRGARWFDLGGVSEGTAGSTDRVGGISDFKRFFAQTVVDVREEWDLDAKRLRAPLSRFLSLSVAWARSLRAGRTGQGPTIS